MMLASITLPTGPYDWDPALIPPGEYELRLARVRESMAALGATRAVVHGNWLDHGGLAWLTGFTPKLGAAYALVPARGELRLIFAGGPGMRPSAARLTWVEDVVASKGLDAALSGWLEETEAGNSGRLALCEGRGMAAGDYGIVQRRAGDGAIEFDGAIATLRRAKSELEHALARRAANALRAGAEMFAARAAIGAGLREVVVASERAAYAAGAQDVRVRVGARAWGAPIVLGDGDIAISGPTRVAFAARARGYWATGSFVAGGALAAEKRDAQRRLGACLLAARPGARLADLAAAAGAAARVVTHGIGLSPEEAPDFAAPAEILMAGDMCSVSLTIPAPNGPAEWSMVVLIGEAAAQLLWAPPGLDLSI